MRLESIGVDKCIEEIAKNLLKQDACPLILQLDAKRNRDAVTLEVERTEPANAQQGVNYVSLLMTLVLPPPAR